MVTEARSPHDPELRDREEEEAGVHSPLGDYFPSDQRPPGRPHLAKVPPLSSSTTLGTKPLTHEPGPTVAETLASTGKPMSLWLEKES
jgi:hypothetical protein